MHFFKHMNKKAAQKGFSLVELMIVVAIIGILASLAVPKFQVFQAKAKQSEAKNNLSHIYTLEQTYYGDNDQFGSDVDIGFSTQGGISKTARYTYKAAAAGGGKFVGTATAKGPDNILAGCGGNDAWQIDETKDLKVTKDCAK